MSKVTIYTDGSARNITHDKGGWGAVIINGSVRQFCGGSYYNTTSQRMELLALVKALSKCEPGDEVTVITDSEYLVKSIENDWVFKWELTNFVGKKNVDLWKRFLIEFSRLKEKVKMQWTKSHNGTQWNEVADILAKRGGQKKLMIDDNGIVFNKKITNWEEHTKIKKI